MQTGRKSPTQKEKTLKFITTAITAVILTTASFIAVLAFDSGFYPAAGSTSDSTDNNGGGPIPPIGH